MYASQLSRAVTDEPLPPGGVFEDGYLVLAYEIRGVPCVSPLEGRNVHRALETATRHCYVHGTKGILYHIRPDGSRLAVYEVNPSG